MEEDGVQFPLEISHCKTTSPAPANNTAVDGLPGETTVADPLTSNQVPVPVTGVLAFNVALAAQTDWLLPALETDGGKYLVIETVSAEKGQMPFTTFHSRRLIPALKLFTDVDGLDEAATEDDPVSTDHVPDPTDGLTAATLVEDVQIAWLLPAWAAAGGKSRVIETVEVEGMHTPFDTLHWNMF